MDSPWAPDGGAPPTPVSVPTPLNSHVEVLDQFGTLVEGVGVTSTEARLVATVALFLVATLAAGVAVPVTARVVRSVASRATDRLEPEGVREAVTDAPWSAGLALFVRGMQALVALLTGVGLLVVWGRVGLAWAALGVLELSAPFVARAVATLALLAGASVATKLLEDRIGRLRARSKRMDQHEEGLLLRVSQVLVFSLATLVALSVWEVELGGLLVGAGFLGIVVGLAARQTLGSLIAGFVLMLSRPLEIGDWVLVDGEEGIVTDITVVNTHLRNFDGEFVVIPNDRVANSVVTNRTREGKLRLRVEVGVDYETDTEFAERVARDAIEGVDVVATTPAPEVVPTGFADSAVTLETRFWIDNPVPPRKWGAVRDVVHAVKTAFEAEGIKIPYPQRELSGRTEEGGFRLAGAEGTRLTASPAANDD